MVEQTKIEFEQKLHSQKLLDCLAKRFQTSCECDVSLIVNDLKIQCHKMILEAESPYFRAMFNSDMIESRQNEISLNNIDYYALADVIDFLYKSKIKLTDDNIFNVIDVIELLQISCLRPFCDKFLTMIISPRNCITIHVLAAHYGFHDVSVKAFRYAQENFLNIYKEDDFLLASYDTILRLFDSKVINIGSEEELMNAIQLWVNYDLNSRSDYLKDFISKSERKKQDNMIASRRNQPTELCFTVGGGTYNSLKELIPIRRVEVLYKNKDWLFYRPDLPTNNGHNVINSMLYCHVFPAVAASDESIYVIGGYDGFESIKHVECYEDNKWKTLPSFPYAVEGAAAACINKRIYVTGGFGASVKITNRVWFLDVGCKSWRETTPMLHKRCHHSLIAFHGLLFAIGGEDDNGKILSSVECFCSGQDCWIEAAPLKIPRSHLGCVVINENIYAVCGMSVKPTDTIERYDIVLNSWELMPESNFFGCVHSHGAAVFNNRLLLIGGRTSKQDALDAVRHLNVNASSNMWHEVSKLIQPRMGHATVTLKFY